MNCLSKKFIGEYPPCWPLIEEGVGAELNYTCERCGHPNDVVNHYVFTVHHLDNNKSNCARWNLAGLCQRCHLHIQGRVNMAQFWMFDHSAWMVPHVIGYYQSMKDNPGSKSETCPGFPTCPATESEVKHG